MLVSNMDLSFFSAGRFCFTVSASTPIVLPVYKGATFHGGFGHALNNLPSSLVQLFQNPVGQKDLLKPYIFIPPLDEDCEYAIGEMLQFELILFGSAIQRIESMGSERIDGVKLMGSANRWGQSN